MKLYYKPGACSLASHIALIETGAPFSIEKVDTQSGKTESGADYRKINGRGYVPALELDDGRVVTEGAAILQFIADSYRESALAPAAGTFERTRLQELLNFVASELHKSFGPFFAKKVPEGEARETAVKAVQSRLQHIDTILADGRPYLLGEKFSVVDAYCFVVANWANFVDISLEKLPHAKALVARVAERPSTIAAMRAEGLID